MGLMSLGEGYIETQGDTGTQRGEGHGKTGAEMGAMRPQAKEPKNHQKLEELRKVSPQVPLEEHGPTNTPFQMSGLKTAREEIPEV